MPHTELHCGARFIKEVGGRRFILRRRVAVLWCGGPRSQDPTQTPLSRSG
jgi:hypothetical protein